MSDEKTAGHIVHSKDADQDVGLPGKMPRPIKLTMLGAGSGFTPTLCRDVLRIPGNDRGEIALVDIDPERLATMHKVIQTVIRQLGQENGWKVTASANRRDVLKGSDYLVNCIEVSGVQCVTYDNDIPLKYGVDQCIGDTIGPGGLFKGLRTVPVWLEILKDAEELCPQALVLNYTNPMSMMCLAAGRTGKMPVVGLCHSVQGSSRHLAKWAGVPYEEMTWDCAGINHLAWFTRLEHNGRDLNPLLREKAAADLAAHTGDPAKGNDLVRKDLMLHFGYYFTESSGHGSEYVPYYRKRKDLLTKYCRAKYEGESRFYASCWPQWRKDADAKRMRLVRGEEQLPTKRSWEYASWIIEAREKNVPQSIHGNVMNVVHGAGPLISNLPSDGCVEVRCLVDRSGIQPVRYGKLPAQCAGLCASNMHMFDLAAIAAVEKSKEAAIQALLLDPLTAAVCSPAEIKKMTLELFEAEADFLPGYK